MIAYYLKEDLKEIWNQCSKQKAKAVLDEWVKQATESKIQPLAKWNKLLANKRNTS